MILACCGVLAAVLAGSPPAQNKQVDAAFARARHGDLEGVAKLSRLGTAAVPAIARYLTDRQESIRIEAVSLLDTIGGPQACARLVQPLTDASEDVRERAATALYTRCERGPLCARADTAAALRKSIQLGNATAAAWLLLGCSGDPASRSFLEDRLKATEPVKLNSWGPLVPADLAAAVALLASGSPLARKPVLAAITNPDPEQAQFLLEVLPEIKDPAVLRDLTALFEDQRPIEGGVPSGVEPKRRVADLAVDAFAARLKLKLPFELSSGRRYTDSEIGQAQNAARAALQPR